MGDLSKPCKILSWNVRSVLNDERLENVLQFIEDNNIMIACLCETWFDSQNGKFTAKMKEAEFEILHANRGGKRGGGVAVVYKKSLKVKPGESSSTKFTSFEFSYCCVQMVRSKVMLVCVYRLQEVSCNIFCEELEKLYGSNISKRRSSNSDRRF